MYAHMSLSLSIYIYIYTYVYMCIYIYIYMYREGERERYTCVYMLRALPLINWPYQMLTYCAYIGVPTVL